MDVKIYSYSGEMSDRANKLIDNIIASVSPTPKWGYCAGGILDTHIFPIDDSVLTVNKAIVPYIDKYYEYHSRYSYPEQNHTVEPNYFECDLKHISRLVHYTIKDEIYLYDVTFIDNGILAFCDKFKIPEKDPQIYEMCWYGRGIYKIDQRSNRNFNLAENMPQESIKIVEQEPSKTDSDNVSGYTYFVDHLSALSIQKDYNKEKNKMIRLNVRENTDHDGLQSVTISNRETLKGIILRLREMESWMGEDKR